MPSVHQTATQEMNFDIEFSGSDDEGVQSKFCFNGIYVQRLYKSQLRPKEVTQTLVNGNSLEEILQCIWKQACKLVRRQVIFEEEIPHWSEKQDPEFEDIDKFVSLQDTVKKKIYATSRITPRLLVSWRSKSIKIFVYAYSTNIESLGQYQLVMRRLIAPQNPAAQGRIQLGMTQY